jgi:hypothetical protein
MLRPIETSKHPSEFFFEYLCDCNLVFKLVFFSQTSCDDGLSVAAEAGANEDRALTPLPDPISKSIPSCLTLQRIIDVDE